MAEYGHIKHQEWINMYSINAYYNAGLAQQRLGRGVEAKAFLEEALRLEPGSADFRIALAILAAQRGQWSEARSQAQRLSREHPEDPRGKALLRRLRQPEPPSP